MTSDIEVSQFIGKNVKDANGEHVGTIVSFLIDSSGHVKEALLETGGTTFVRYPLERLRIGRDDICLVTDAEKKVDLISQEFPTIQKKKKILQKLSENNEIPSEIYENLSAEFDKALAEIKSEAQILLDDIGKEVKAQEEFIKMLHLARTFLEMEHGVDNVKDEEYQKTLISLLKGIGNASHGKISLLRIKDKVNNILLSGEEPKTEIMIKDQNDSIGKSAEEKTAVTVHVTQE